MYTGFSKEISLFKQFFKMADQENFNRHFSGSGKWSAVVFLQNMCFCSQFLVLSKSLGVSALNASFLSGISCMALFYPFLTLVRRFQADSLIKYGEYKYLSLEDAYRVILRTEGWTGFYKGINMYLVTNGLMMNFTILAFLVLYENNRMMEF